MKKVLTIGIFFVIFLGLPLASQAAIYNQGSDCNTVNYQNYTYPVYYPVYNEQPYYYTVPAQCECSSGPCCDGCHFMSEAKICSAQNDAQYGCAWGTGCGSDVATRTRTRLIYCSGYSASCNGRQTDWSAYSGWTLLQNCGNTQSCVEGISTCQTNSSCAVVNEYVKHYKSGCSENGVYWFDSNESKNDVQKNCDDTNSCTVDSCDNGKCLNDLKCDGSACAVGSDDYCNKCSNHCGDKTCNCNENKDNCAADCSQTEIAGATADTNSLKSIGSIGGNLSSGLKSFFSPILKYWYVWFIIILLAVFVWVFFAETQGGGESAFIYGILKASNSRKFWLGLLGVIAIALLVSGAKGIMFLAFLFTRWYFVFILGLILFFFIFKILNKSILAKYVAKG